MNPYSQFVEDFARLKQEGKKIPLGKIEASKHPALPSTAPRVLIFAPHPDDECIIGALPLRLFRDAGMQVINIAVTQGSKKERQGARWKELEAACGYLGFGLVQTRPGGLERITFKTRQENSDSWQSSVSRISGLLREHKPKIIFFPHELDWNSAHIGTHWLVRDALEQLEKAFTCYLVETEFWGQMPTPNLMVESSVSEVAELVAATSFHIGEVERNPYHLLLPAWMQDNVRRGGELVGGQGGAAPDFTFATLYRRRQWHDGTIVNIQEKGEFLPQAQHPATLFT